MRIFEIVKENVNLREAAELYGIDVNKYGKALCPFHNDRHPSLYVADDHYHCFACGEHGDVIDFVSKLFHLSLYDAVQKLAADFHLTILSDYAHVLRDWKVRYAPQSPAEAPDERFVEACHKLDEVEYYLDILTSGNSYERSEVIHQQMANGKLGRLRQRLEKIHEEESEDGYDTADVA